MAPVLGSGCDPAWINLVAGFIEVSGFWMIYVSLRNASYNKGYDVFCAFIQTC